MDNKTRIEKEAKEHFDKIGRKDDGNEMRAYIAGANVQFERMYKLIEAAFVAGRSNTTWEQFKKGNEIDTHV